MLSVLLLLRHLLKDATAPVHIIGENQEDTTALLALAPHKTHDPDFINTQAIVARALCQSIAFPKMTESIDSGAASTCARVACAATSPKSLAERDLRLPP